MGDCDYWIESDEAQWCDLVDQACACGGSDERCRIKGQSISDALRQQERITLKEASDRAQKYRHGLKEASYAQSTGMRAWKPLGKRGLIGSPRTAACSHTASGGALRALPAHRTAPE